MSKEPKSIHDQVMDLVEVIPFATEEDIQLTERMIKRVRIERQEVVDRFMELMKRYPAETHDTIDELASVLFPEPGMEVSHG